MKRTLMLAFLVIVAFTLNACETVEGFGRDLEKVGGKIEKAANKDDKADVEDAKPD